MAVCHKGNYNYNHNHYSNPSFNHKSFKISPFDFTDHDKSIKSNNVPIWQCSRCTFTNTSRKSNCSICNFSYKQSKSYKTKQSKAAFIRPSPRGKGFSNKPKNSPVTLADFCDNIMHQLKPSVPVWICNVCTYCNIQQLPLCQMCFNPYSLNEQQDYEFVSSAEQQLIIDSVNLSKKQQIDPTDIKTKKRAKFSMDKLLKLREKQCESMPGNIINEIPDILSPGLGRKMPPKSHENRAKFSMDTLMKLRGNKQCEAMPMNIINEMPKILSFGLGRIRSTTKRVSLKVSMDSSLKLENSEECELTAQNIITNIPEILSHGFGVKTEEKSKKNRAKFRVDKLINLRHTELCQLMPENIIYEMPAILSLGLGLRIQPKCVEKRDKFSVNELKKLRDCESCKLMPANIINEIPHILSPGLGRKRIKFRMDKLMQLRHDAQCQIMPEIFSFGLGIKTQKLQKTDEKCIANAKRSKYAISKLMALQKCKVCHAMPSNIINEIPEILSFGLGHKHRNRAKRIKFTINQLIILRYEGNGRHGFSLKKLKKLRFADGFDSMPDDIINEIPQILAPGLGVKEKKEMNGFGFIVKARLLRNNYSAIHSKQETEPVIAEQIEMNGNANMDKFYRKKRFYLKQKYKKILKRNKYKKKNKDATDGCEHYYHVKRDQQSNTRCVQRKWSSHSHEIR